MLVIRVEWLQLGRILRLRSLDEVKQILGGVVHSVRNALVRHDCLLHSSPAVWIEALRSC